MSNIVIFAAIVELITLYTIDGRAVVINPKQVTQLQEARSKDDERKQLTGEVQCVVRFTDGSYTSVAEDCDTVRELMEQPKENK